MKNTNANLPCVYCSLCKIYNAVFKTAFYQLNVAEQIHGWIPRASRVTLKFAISDWLNCLGFFSVFFSTRLIEKTSFFPALWHYSALRLNPGNLCLFACLFVDFFVLGKKKETYFPFKLDRKYKFTDFNMAGKEDADERQPNVTVRQDSAPLSYIYIYYIPVYISVHF